MNVRRISYLPAAALILGTLAMGLPARAELTTKADTLTCHVDHGFGFVFGSSRSLACTYTNANDGRIEHYTGDVSKFGVHIGHLQSGVIVWAVLAPTTNQAAGALSCGYVGVTAGGSLGAGAGANVPSGGSENALFSQPISIEGDTGLNVAAGIAAMTLKYASARASAALGGDDRGVDRADAAVSHIVNDPAETSGPRQPPHAPRPAFSRTDAGRGQQRPCVGKTPGQCGCFPFGGQISARRMNRDFLRALRQAREVAP
jgi:hypothetical protein